MKKICITSYYGLRDSLLCAAKSLEKMGHCVVDFPLLCEKLNFTDYVDRFIKFIITEKINVILWWFIDIPTDFMNQIVSSTDVKHIYFNWDEPHNWPFCDIKNKAKNFDCVFVCCDETKNEYLKYGTKQAEFLLPGYSSNINYVLTDDHLAVNYDCDVSFICTNLYENENSYPNQYINRKKIIDNIYQNQINHNYIFHIYGPEFLKNIYPKSYKGYISYDNQNLLFNKSKINICTHVMNNKSKYLNERAIMIAGSGGLLLIDDVKNLNEIFLNGTDCVIIDKNDYISQIVNILNNYEQYFDVRYNLHVKSQQYTWDKWAEYINDKFLVVCK